MARKRKPKEPENHERWLVSYADFITLLFAFFVVMFATSQTDKGKAAQVSESVQRALEEGRFSSALASIFGGTVGDKGVGNMHTRGPGGDKQVKKEDGERERQVAELAPALDVLQRELEEEIRAGAMEVTLEARGLVVSLRQAAFFPSGEDVLAANTFKTIQKIASIIEKLPNRVRLEGHTDSIPIHNSRFRSNWDLSAARSIAMLDMFVNHCKLPQERFSVGGYAQNTPIDTNETEEGRAHNRRVDIVILSATGAKAEPASAEKKPSPLATPQPANPAPALKASH